MKGQRQLTSCMVYDLVMIDFPDLMALTVMETRLNCMRTSSCIRAQSLRTSGLALVLNTEGQF